MIGSLEVRSGASETLLRSIEHVGQLKWGWMGWELGSEMLKNQARAGYNGFYYQDYQ